MALPLPGRNTKPPASIWAAGSPSTCRTAGRGAGEAVDVDEEGRLVVRTDSGEVHVFTGEVSVHGIYGAV